eukprot:7619654-Karenia_brevis.AAC.1
MLVESVGKNDMLRLRTNKCNRAVAKPAHCEADKKCSLTRDALRKCTYTHTYTNTHVSGQVIMQHRPDATVPLWHKWSGIVPQSPTEVDKGVV